jgi:hypothetical protein
MGKGESLEVAGDKSSRLKATVAEKVGEIVGGGGDGELAFVGANEEEAVASDADVRLEEDSTEA